MIIFINWFSFYESGSILESPKKSLGGVALDEQDPAGKWALEQSKEHNPTLFVGSASQS